MNVGCGCISVDLVGHIVALGDVDWNTWEGVVGTNRWRWLWLGPWGLSLFGELVPSGPIWLWLKGNAWSGVRGYTRYWNICM